LCHAGRTLKPWLLESPVLLAAYDTEESEAAWACDVEAGRQGIDEIDFEQMRVDLAILEKISNGFRKLDHG
jgi:hypothetical protein